MISQTENRLVWQYSSSHTMSRSELLFIITEKQAVISGL